MDTIGILALQGGYMAHGRALKKLGQTYTLVKQSEQLKNISGLIIPGGETTALLKLLTPSMIETLQMFKASHKPILGTCAGAILLAKHVINPEQYSLGFLDISIERNAYGRQVDSFMDFGVCEKSVFGVEQLKMMFIRAPKISKLGPNVNVLASHNDKPVLVQADHILAATFHPELIDETYVHQYFIQLCEKNTAEYSLTMDSFT